MKLRNLISILLLLTGATAFAQVTVVDGHYVDPKQGQEANPTGNPDWSLMKGTVKKTVTGKRNAPIAPAANYGLPDHVNNGANKYFRSPVANQSGNSCGITSRYSHMMAYELNAYRDKDGSLAENMLPAHFAFVPAYNEDPNKENYAKYVGIPDGATFGGTNVSTIYGGPYSESSNNYGRMQGYENWHKAMFNRITDNPNFPNGAMTEAGALAWKRWLYNHNGDESFHAGGIIGIGLASSGLYAETTIASTTANDNAGVTGMYYLRNWGTGVDHAMVVVGYDDRIEFDLDGDGTYGSSSNHFGQNETGAWIVANSWGSGWCNNGFLYVPYALASPTSTTVTSGNYSGYKAGDANGWTGEIYKIRKDYTPIRTLKAAVAYSKRSEIQICVGISTNLNASSPDKTLVLANHNYHGDYDGNGSDAEVPMLGQWTDGKLHTEAMEFGYDLTDFTNEFDRCRPLKYFLIINTKDGASGTGNIEYASIMDYELNANGVETPFASKNVNITNNGGTTTISTIVYGEAIFPPSNLTLSSTTLTWNTPQNTRYTPSGYYIYLNGESIGSSNTTSYDIGSATGSFYVTACYNVDGRSYESQASNTVSSNLPSGNFISYIGDPITAVSQLTSDMYVVLKCYGQGKYVYDNSSAYLLSPTAPDVLNTDYYKYVFKVTKNSSSYKFQSVNGYLPSLSSSTAAVPSNSAGNYTVTAGGDNLFILKSSVYLNGTSSSTLIGWSGLDNNDRYYIYPVNVSITGSNTLNVNIVDPGTVYAGVPVQLHLDGAADIVSATWTVDGTSYSGVSPVVTFSSAGSKSVSCTATDSKNHSKKTSKSITVSAAPTATANFTLSSTSTTGSDRISFLSQNTVPGCTYSWSMPDAEEPTATTRNVSATYLSSGQKTVTLTVTCGSNTYTHSETFMVNASAPASRYSISPAIVVKNNPVTLTDKSLYNPTSWNWRFESDNNRISCTTQNGTITPTKAGVYKLTFRTDNALGYDYVETERALIVCNSASYQGLTFAGGNQYVTATLSSALTTTWTIDFWFNPKSLGATTQGITGSKSSNSFTITSDASGIATLTVGSSSVSTDKLFYISNEWHHYAITFSNGTVNFYRDGSLISTKSVSTTDFSSYFQNLKLGGSSAPMNGSIDEFRVWSTTLSQANIRSYCVAPISTSTSGLTLYWQMNQSSGTSITAAKGVTGTLNNFNNAGDAWSDSEGVFALDFSSSETTAASSAGSLLSHAYDNIYSVSDEQDGKRQRASLGQAFDGNTSTYYQSRWESGGYLSEADYPHYFVLRRGALHEINAFNIYSNNIPVNWNGTPPSASYGRAAYITIEESEDLEDWTLVDRDIRLFDVATNNVILPRSITKEYVRFTFSEPLYNDGNYAALLINEMNFYGTAQEPTLTPVTLTYVSCSDEGNNTSTNTDQLGSKAVDGNDATFWHSHWERSGIISYTYTGTPYPHSITLQNEATGVINMLKFYQQHSESGNQNGSYRAGGLNVETSNDNITWTTAFEGLRIPYGNTGYVKLPEAINTRYIKLTFTRDQSTVKGDNDDDYGTNLAMNEITAYGVESSVTVTWKVVDANNNVKYTVDQTCPSGVQIIAYPDELTAWEEKYVQLEALTPFTPTSNMTKTVTCTYNTPFTISDDVTTYYYNLGFLYYTSWYYDNANCLTNLLSSTTNGDNAMTMSTSNDGSQAANQWAFYGNPFDGFTIKNRSTAKMLYHNNALNNSGIPVLSESNETVWNILPSLYDGTGKDNAQEFQTTYSTAFTVSSGTFFLMNYSGGNVLKFYSDAQADKFAGIKATLAATETLSNTVTWNVVDENDNVLCTVDKTYTTGTEVTEYPTELTDWIAQYEDRFVALPSLTSFTVTADVVKDVPYEWTGPFQLTTDINNPRLYYFKSVNGGYYPIAPVAVGSVATHSTTKNQVITRSRWFFMGNPFDGVEIRPYSNKNAGLNMWTLSETPQQFIPVKSNSATGAIGFQKPGADLCISKNGEQWYASAIPSDGGCAFVMEDGSDTSMILPNGYYRIHNAADGYTDIYMSVDEENNAMCNNRKYNKSIDAQYTVFRVEEQTDGTFVISKNGYYLKGANSATTNSEEAANCNIAYNSTYNAFTIQIASGSSGYANIDTWSTDLAAWSIEARSTWIIEPVAPVTLNIVGDNSYATFYYDRDVQTDANTKAYYITSTNNGYAQLTEVANEGHDIPAYTAVVLVNNAKANSALFEVTSGLNAVVAEGSNLLKGTLTSMSLDLSDNTPYYSMGRLGGVIGFYKFSGGTITLGANKAYLDTTTPSGNEVKGFTFDFETGIEEVDNGQWTMDNVQIYNLAGQRLSKPQRGINIINGKKVLVK